MKFTSGQVYGIPTDRAHRIAAELLVYAMQRCCNTKTGLVSEEKLIQMICIWTGTHLTAHENVYLHFLAGKLAKTIHACKMLRSRYDLDLGLGSEHCISVLQTVLGSLESKIQTHIQSIFN
jgi:hypothetical protein